MPDYMGIFLSDKSLVLIFCRSWNKYKSLQDNSLLIYKKAKNYVIVINSIR